MSGNEQVQRSGADPALPAAHPLRHVLVVDDDADIRWAVRLLLEDEGYVVGEAPAGNPALECLRETEQGMVVLLDVLMPGMDGIQVMDVVTAEDTLATRHAYIMVTALDDALTHVVLDRLHALGVPVLAKPFDIDELIAAVQTAERVLDARPC